MDAPGEWRAIEEIKQLKARYCRMLDAKQWDAWRLLFRDDARFEGTSSPPAGADDFVAAVRRIMESARTVHHVHAPEIVLRGDDRALGVWALHDCVMFPEPRKMIAGGDPVHGFVGYGHYEEEYRRCGDGWRISFLRLTRLRIDLVGAVETSPIGPPMLAHDPDWLASP